MQSLYYVAGIIGVAAVIVWAILNEKKSRDGRTFGLFAMREPEQEPEEASVNDSSGSLRVGTDSQRFDK